MDSDGSPQRDNQHLAFGHSIFACVIALVSKNKLTGGKSNEQENNPQGFASDDRKGRNPE